MGPNWNFEPLAEGECLANVGFPSKYNITQNETIIFNIEIDSILHTIHHNYNKLAKENGWEKMKNIHEYKNGTKTNVTIIPMPCKIVNFWS